MSEKGSSLVTKVAAIEKASITPEDRLAIQQV
jgi:hypothetical protein